MLKGKCVVVTAGPTQEPIDPVRYLTNRSSGKMGYALAEAALAQGARVVLISGPTNLEAPKGAILESVETAQAMLETALGFAHDADVFIASAAVADYRPQVVSGQKIKKNADTLVLELVKNPDILQEVGQAFPALFKVGFAAETENVLEHAWQKLVCKQLDMLVANDVGRSDIGFDHDDNEVAVLYAHGQVLKLPKQSKHQLALKLIELIGECYEAKSAS